MESIGPPQGLPVNIDLLLSFYVRNEDDATRFIGRIAEMPYFVKRECLMDETEADSIIEGNAWNGPEASASLAGRIVTWN
jgi:hypothetical protein